MIFLARPAIIAGQVHTEWYRSGYNGPDSKSGVPATVPWVRIPPTPPNNIHPHLGMDVVFLLWVRFESRRLGDMPVACRNRRGRIPPTPPVGCVIRGWMLFFCCGWDSKAGALATCRWHVATGVGESHPLRRLAASSGDGCCFLLWVGFESRRLGDMPAACRNRRGRDEKFMPRRGKACPRCVQPRTQKARNQMPF